MQMKENINLEILFILIFIVIASGIYGCSKNEKIAEGRYTVYYFHPTARCEGCINMESYMKELIEKKYKEIIIFKAINIEDKENQHYRKEFDLKFSSVIVEEEDTKRWKNLDSVWTYTEDKEKFIEYADRNIENFINKGGK